MDQHKEALLNGLWCSAALAANLLCCQMGQGRARFAAGERPPEDVKLSLAKKFNKQGIEQNFTGAGLEPSDRNLKAKENAQRWARNHTNALENVLIGLIVGWGTLVATKGNAAQINLFRLFVASRWLHTITYHYAMQPHRAICWLGGWISIIGLCYNSIANFE